jgi:hypothetical protein
VDVAHRHAQLRRQRAHRQRRIGQLLVDALLHAREVVRRELAERRCVRGGQRLQAGHEDVLHAMGHRQRRGRLQRVEVLAQRADHAQQQVPRALAP